MRKWPYLSSWVMNRKTKVTLLSQTLKVEEKKVSLFFWFVTQELRYGHFIFWTSVSEVRIIVKGRKCQYLGPWAINKKTKDTLLSQTLKVENKKVSLFCNCKCENCNSENNKQLDLIKHIKYYIWLVSRTVRSHIHRLNDE